MDSQSISPAFPDLPGHQDQVDHSPIIITVLIIILMSIYIYRKQRNKYHRKCIENERNVSYRQPMSKLSTILFKNRVDLEQKSILESVDGAFVYESFGHINLVIGEPELIQLVLSKEFSSFPNRREFDSTDPFFANSLLAVDLDRWKRLRAIVSQTFATGKLRRMKPCLDSICKTLINNMKTHLNDKEKLNMKDFCGAFAMDSIIQVAFGTKVDSLIEPDNAIIMNAKKFFGQDMSMINRIIYYYLFMGPKFLQKLSRNIRMNSDVTDFFLEFSTKIIDQKRKEFAEKQNSFGGKSTTFIEFLLEAEHEYEQQFIKFKQAEPEDDDGELEENNNPKKPVKYMTNVEITSQCILFLMAGYDATATAMSMATYYLALNPDKQQLAYEEVCSVLEEYGDDLESLPFESFSQEFEFINGVVCETLRMTDSGQILERRCVNDITLKTEDESMKINVKKDDLIHIPVTYLHYNEKYFPEPEKFQPERFIPGHPLNSFHKYAYLPFGSGPRACVAKSLALLEAKMGLVWLIKHFRFSCCDKTKVPVEYFNQGGFLSPRDITVKVEPRNMNNDYII